jgi:hypothetical protein
MNNLSGFYSSLYFHLLDAGVENLHSIAGYSESEIAAAEFSAGINFPEAYKLFLQNFGERANFHNSHEYQLACLPDALDVMHGMASTSQVDFQKLFPYSQWQGYSLFCFKLGSDNPNVVLIVEGEDGIEQYGFPSFTNWVLNQIKIHLGYLRNQRGVSCQTQRLEEFIAKSILAFAP